MLKASFILGLALVVTGCGKAPVTTSSNASSYEHEDRYEVARECKSGTTVYKLSEDGKYAIWQGTNTDSDPGRFVNLADSVTPELYCESNGS